MIVRVELPVPDGMDPSTVLERVSALAVELAEEFAEDEDAEIDVAALEDRVSVEVLDARL